MSPVSPFADAAFKRVLTLTNPLPAHGADTPRCDAVYLPFTLSRHPERSADLLALAFERAPLVLVLDFRLPGRNLDYPLHLLNHLAQFAKGAKKYRRFRLFAESGGLYALAQPYVIVCEGIAGGGRFLLLGLARACSNSR